MFLRFAISAVVLATAPSVLAQGGARAAKSRAGAGAHEVDVRPGESMGVYGRWAKLDMHELYRRTTLRWNERLRVGRKLSIRLSDEERARFDAARAAFHQERETAYLAGGTSEHRLRAGDNPWRIARRLGVPVWAIERLNDGKNWRRLKIGDVIKVPSSRVSRR